MRMLVIAIMSLIGAATCSAEETLVDLKLVLAVDASGSVDAGEYRLQLDGIAQAFRDSEIIKAIASGPGKRIAVDLLVWAQHEVPKDQTGWFVLQSTADCERFATRVESFPRYQNGATGMGEGLAAALRAMEQAGIAAPREVVDISGDGAETPARDYFVMMPQARMMASVRGVTVNGLAILGEAGLEDWYRANVLLGAGSFLEIADGYGDFTRAMRRKLLREIEHQPRLSLN